MARGLGKNSLRSVFKTAYEANKPKREQRKNYDKDDDFYGEDEYKEDYDKFYEIVDGLYCIANNIKDPILCASNNRWIPKKDLKIEVNEVSKCIILALMKMDSKKSSFISKIRNKKFDQITNEDKLMYLECVFHEIKNIDLPVPYIANRDERMSDDEFRKSISDFIDDLTWDIKFDINLQKNKNNFVKNVSHEMEEALREIFPAVHFENIPYPKVYKNSGININYNTSNTKYSIDYDKHYLIYLSKLIFENIGINFNEFSSFPYDLSSEEKEYIIDLLEKDVLASITYWKEKVKEAIYQKTII